MVSSIEWHTAAPLWPKALEDPGRTRFKQPALLRFAEDTFMETLAQALACAPDIPCAGLPGFVARRETWSEEAVGWLPEGDLELNEPLKLYQPAHGRFYLVAASLVCRQRGLPDKAIDTARGEATSFVLRRLVATNGTIEPDNPLTYNEYGWLPGTGWQRVNTPGKVGVGEERLPMFATTYCANGHRRRLLAGLVPVASREAFQAAPALSPLPDPDDVPTDDPLADPRLARFGAQVVTPLLALIGDLFGGPGAPPAGVTVDQVREALVFAMLDLMYLLEEYLPDVHTAILADDPTGLPTAERNLYDKLDALLEPASSPPGDRWSDILREVWSNADAILGGAMNDPGELDLIVDDYTKDELLTAIDLWGVDDLKTKMDTALGDYEPPADTPDPVTAPKIDTRAGALYVVRCVYDRPGCRLPSQQQVVSAPSHAFQLAPYFDPDAPARPVRVTMPVDTSVAGLRRFPKNVSFLISDQLRNQIERVQGITLQDLDEGNIGDDPGLNLGMICSLSIPIITICALILLMIIVGLLNIVFWWLPFFKICFPLSLKAE